MGGLLGAWLRWTPSLTGRRSRPATRARAGCRRPLSEENEHADAGSRRTIGNVLRLIPGLKVGTLVGTRVLDGQAVRNLLMIPRFGAFAKMVRQRTANPSFSGSNPEGASKDHYGFRVCPECRISSPLLSVGDGPLRGPLHGILSVVALPKLTRPLIALARADVLDTLGKLQLAFVVPQTPGK